MEKPTTKRFYHINKIITKNKKKSSYIHDGENAHKHKTHTQFCFPFVFFSYFVPKTMTYRKTTNTKAFCEGTYRGPGGWLLHHR